MDQPASQGWRPGPRAAVTAAVLALILALVMMTPHARAGDQRPPDPNIVGGGDAPAGMFPFMAALIVSSYSYAPYGQFCGGALIAPTWVLTAAHCISSSGGGIVSPASIDVVLGLTDLRLSGGERIHVAQILRHPQYNAGTTNYDYALLGLSQVSVQPVVTIAGPSDGDLIVAGAPVVVAGWGTTSEGGSTSPTLKYVQVPVVSDGECALDYAGSGINGAVTVCAGLPQGGADSCQGDSGGPLMARRTPSSPWIEVGIVSWGNGCARPGYPGVYSQVDGGQSWITAATGVQPGGGGTTTPTASPTATATYSCGLRCQTTTTATATATASVTATGTASPTATATYSCGLRCQTTTATTTATSTATSTATGDPDDGRILVSGGQLSGTINPASDLDTYDVDVTAGQSIVIAMNAAGRGLNPYLELYSPANALLVSNDDGGGWPNARISWPATTTGRYRIVARSTGGSSAGSYTIQVTLTP